MSLRLNWHALVTGSQRVGAGGSLFCSLCFCLRGEFPSHSNMFFKTSSAKATELRPPRSHSPGAGVRCYGHFCVRPAAARHAGGGSRWLALGTRTRRLQAAACGREQAAVSRHPS